MKTIPLRGVGIRGMLAAAVFAVSLSGCVAYGGGYGYGYDGPAVGVGLDYGEPYGDYGGWGPGYRVGPYRGAGDNRGGGGGGGHHFRQAPAGHAMPSMPHGGGGHGGGGHGGGGHGH